ncbi:alpha/beta fold hydrolase [Nocardiopsis ganjiahuensis]|uniref:alpha/beta fold hydrolase n=1 Tax=Nocardiopsis ganjiahuensis TaxID=239984 RepID=UPI000688369E|nr:alpha/beta hydrolase [Nocardiopsis ganjiahuensis]
MSAHTHGEHVSADRPVGDHSPGERSLRVPGARIHHEVRGSGPLLILIPGGPQDAGVLADPARRLADRYTTVAYDPRGNSRSVLDEVAGDAADGDQRLDVHADDAARLIRSLGGGPAYVFGTSGGAQIALALAALHPGLVRAVVAHEPPCVMLLDDPSEVLAHDREIHETYLRDGVEAGIALFLGLNDLDGPDQQGPDAGGEGPPPMSEEDAATFERVSGNFEYFLAHGMLPLSLYRPDVEALRRDGTRVTVGLGEGSVGQDIHDIGSALAEALGVDPVAFPGDHLGYEAEPEAFTSTLRRVLAGA